MPAASRPAAWGRAASRRAASRRAASTPVGWSSAAPRRSCAWPSARTKGAPRPGASASARARSTSPPRPWCCGASRYRSRRRRPATGRRGRRRPAAVRNVSLHERVIADTPTDFRAELVGKEAANATSSARKRKAGGASGRPDEDARVGPGGQPAHQRDQLRLRDRHAPGRRRTVGDVQEEGAPSALVHAARSVAGVVVDDDRVVVVRDFVVEMLVRGTAGERASGGATLVGVVEPSRLADPPVRRAGLEGRQGAAGTPVVAEGPGEREAADRRRAPALARMGAHAWSADVRGDGVTVLAPPTAGGLRPGLEARDGAPPRVRRHGDDAGRAAGAEVQRHRYPVLDGGRARCWGAPRWGPDGRRAPG